MKLLACLPLLLGLGLAEPPPPVAPETQWELKTSDGVILHGMSLGAGPDLLYLHGGPGFPPFETPTWLKALATNYRVHWFHQRGSGRSARPLLRLPEGEERARERLVETYGIERQLLDIAEVRTAQCAARPLVLVGHSFGGFLATLFASQRPAGLKSVILLAPADVIDGRLTEKPIFDTIAERLPAEEHGDYRARMEHFMKPVHLAGKEDAELALATDWFGYYFLRASGRKIPRPDTYPQMRWSGGAGVAGLFLDLRAGGDRRSALARIAVHTLVLHGAEDLARPEASARYADGIEGARFEELTGVGHFFDQEPASIAERIARFLKVDAR